ncbi:DNA ligase 1 [Zancudomyces culisetae]|uniref:DNA ligase n=1 Tax=Zancudomyces culisetae TaxID=1213189 RepID=A0A1R1PX73_ZANCU|nr:DNA ligase 1 [Zancudomyces culisetae]|eukprot:OMH85523.1 DNA ligase 1 [Zancudomyces culisetae]
MNTKNRNFFNNPKIKIKEKEKKEEKKEENVVERIKTVVNDEKMEVNAINSFEKQGVAVKKGKAAATDPNKGQKRSRKVISSDSEAESEGGTDVGIASDVSANGKVEADIKSTKRSKSADNKGPEYEGLELGIGESILMKAIAGATGRQVSKVKSEASSSSMQKKVDKISSLIVGSKDIEARYIVRSLEGKLRIGLAEKTVITGLGQALARNSGTSKLSSEEIVDMIKEAFTQVPNYEVVIENIMTYGIENLKDRCKITPGIPVRPMLAMPIKSIEEVKERIDGQEATCEYKYDGERIQIHYIDGVERKSFSRNMENNTAKYRDILGKVQTKQPQVKNYIIDAEVVAYDYKANKILPFQVLSTRKRKEDVQKEDSKENEVDLLDSKVPVKLFAFDVLYFDGKPTLQTSLKERRALLEREFVIDDHFGIVEYKNIQYKNGNTKQFFSNKRGDADEECSAENAENIVDENMEIIEFLNKSIGDSCEGLMVKLLGSEASYYEPNKRSRNWIKVKKDYLAASSGVNGSGGGGIGDSIDLVVLGAYYGKGKRTGFYGGFLLGCYDPDREEFQSCCKLGTGFSDADLDKFAKELKPLVVEKVPFQYSYDVDQTKPDVWFDPKAVWEIKAADLSLSPIYKAGIGLVSNDKGISLRFPRFIRERPDKTPEQSTSADQIAELFEAQ